MYSQNRGADTALKLPYLLPVDPVGIGDEDVGGSLILRSGEGGPLRGHTLTEIENNIIRDFQQLWLYELYHSTRKERRT